MSMIDNVRRAPLGAVTIYRTVEALAGLYDSVMGGRRGHALTEFTPGHLEDIGLSAADYIEPTRPGGLRGWVRDGLAQYRTARELSRLTAAQLDDIGLTHADVDRMSSRAFF